MGPSNLAVVLAPYLLSSNRSDPSNALKDTAVQSSVTHRLIRCWPLICQCDPELLVHIVPPVSPPSGFEKRADIIGNPTDVVCNTDISEPTGFKHTRSGHVSRPTNVKHNLHM